MKKQITRRRFLGAAALTGTGLAIGAGRSIGKTTAKPVILGGEKIPGGAIPAWPVFDQREEEALREVLHSGKWFRHTGKKVAAFEKAYEDLTGAKHCVVTSSGTTALLTTLGALGIGPGDEVILPPYTFVATYNVITYNYALPIFVDTDIETFQIDAKKISNAITGNTKLILPVHLGGTAADMDTINSVAEKAKVPVIEDACQAHLAEWKKSVVGNQGLAGCYSFQASKNLTAGEGGAIITNDDAFAEACESFQTQGRGRGDRAANFRLSEFQAGILLAQLTRLNEQAGRRDQNAASLTKLLQEIPGIIPVKRYEGCTRSSYHLYMFRYQKEKFANLDRAKFLAALAKEGIPCSAGYTPLNTDKFVQALAKNRHYLKIYGKETMANWQERNRCPENDKVCAQAAWFTQAMMLGSAADMERIAEAIRRIQAHAGDIANI